MSVAKITQLLIDTFHNYTGVLVTVSGGGVQVATVKTGAGKLAKLVVVTGGGITVTPEDNATPIGPALINTDKFDFIPGAIPFATSLKLSFSGNGSAWVYYK